MSSTPYQCVVEGVIERFADDFPCTCPPWTPADKVHPDCTYHRVAGWLESQVDLP